MDDARLFFDYTAEVLAHALGPEDGASPVAPAFSETAGSRTEAVARAGRILRAARDAGKRRIVLLGLGDAFTVRELAGRLGPDLEQIVCEADPALARRALAAGLLDWPCANGPARFLCDASEWALFCLLRREGLDPENALIAFAPGGGSQPGRARLGRLRRLLTGVRPRRLAPPPEARRPTLACAAILSPDEPDLLGFFRAIPSRADSLTILWDAPDVPGAARRLGAADMPTRHVARPLAGDFAAQRNALLAACQGDRILVLDADERPGPGFCEALPSLLGEAGVGRFLFPRLTLYPDPDRTKIGYGLWPDLQPRLFTPGPAVRYVRPVHERLEGVAGASALALGAPILHLSNLLKDRAALADKLRVFDAAGHMRHRLSRDYPHLPLARLLGGFAADEILELPED